MVMRWFDCAAIVALGLKAARAGALRAQWPTLLLACIAGPLSMLAGLATWRGWLHPDRWLALEGRCR